MVQVLQAGDRQLISLELDPDLIAKIARQVGFTCEVTDGKRSVLAELRMEGRESPLLLFDAAEPANLGWFSRCQFYVDGHTGAVLQTPIYMANQRDSSGRPLPNSIRLQVSKEIPAGFKVAGRQQVNEQVVYSVLASLLAALLETGVAICGGSLVKPLAGRVRDMAGRN
ncbi:MAG: hypothetical protein ACE141_03160 [Bryobacteraceae bacterium]